MRILFVNNFCGYYGGVEQIVADYAQGLVGLGHQCFLVYASEGRDPVAYMDPFQGVYQCSQMGIDNTGQTFTALTNRIKPDIVFVHKVNALPPRL